LAGPGSCGVAPLVPGPGHVVPGLAVWRGRGSRRLAGPARMRELAAAAARELARGSGSLSRAGLAGPAPGRRWPSSPDLRLSLAQRPALRLQLAPGGEPGRLRPLALPSSSRRPPRPAAVNGRGRTIRGRLACWNRPSPTAARGQRCGRPPQETASRSR